MTKTELNVFRRILEKRQTNLSAGRTSREALAIESSSDELDRIQHACERDYAMDNLERNSKRLREVRSALDRMDEGAFGICAGCEGVINPKRLAAIPWASFCIVCQETADHQQKAPLDEFDTTLNMAA